MADKKIVMVCDACGSDNVGLDAWAAWDVESQEWVLGAVFSQHQCHDCELSSKGEFREIPADDYAPYKAYRDDVDAWDNNPLNYDDWCEEQETEQSITCDQCEMLSINGFACHEISCPNSSSRWDAEAGEWRWQRECFECGCMVDEGDPCCNGDYEPEEEEPESEFPWICEDCGHQNISDPEVCVHCDADRPETA